LFVKEEGKMKVIFDRETLLAGFSSVAAVVPARGPKEILQFVKVEASQEGGVMLMGTDMEVGVRVEFPETQVEVPGSALVPVSRFGNLLRESLDEHITLEGNEQGVTISGDRFEVQLMAGDPAEYPEIPVFEEEKYHEIPAKLVKELIRRTIYATDDESTRYAFGGILFEMTEQEIVAVGTDGRRLAKMQGPAQGVSGHKTEAGVTVVPSRAMQIIERSISDVDADVLIAARENDLLVRAGRVSLFARMVSGRFPDWRQVFPGERQAVKIALPVGPTLAALRQAAIVSTKDSRGVDFRFREGSLILAASAAETGRSHVELPVSYDGAELSLCLDHRFVLDFLRVLDPEKSFTMEAENNEQAVVFSTDDGYQYVVMPLARSTSDEE
jgi:DNA polymerase-3 subunit beta